MRQMLRGDFGILAFKEALSAANCPLVGLDFNDEAELSTTALKILERAVVFFKRELPTDIHRLLPRGASAAQRLALERNAHKLTPVSLGLCSGRVANLPAGREEKEYDLFFSGDTSSEVRNGEIHLLAKLRESGVRVFQPQSRMSQQEFLKACGRSWLVWSPEGRGWDCFRHYEAAAAGSVPVINVPPITCFRPLVHGLHALYYASEFRDPKMIHGDFRHVTDGFVPTVLNALKDRARLETMGQEARAFAICGHTHEAIVSHILETAESRLAHGH